MQHLADLRGAADPAAEAAVTALPGAVLAEDDVQARAEAQRLAAGEPVDVLEVADLAKLDRPVLGFVSRQVGQLQRRQLRRARLVAEHRKHRRPPRLVERAVAEHAHQATLPARQPLRPVENPPLQQGVLVGHPGSFSDAGALLRGRFEGDEMDPDREAVG